MLRFLNRVTLLVAGALIVVGAILLFGTSFTHAEAVGGLIAGAGAGVLLTELTAVQQRAAAAAEGIRATLAYARLESTAVFGPMRRAADLGEAATHCLLGEESPASEALARFEQLCDALGLSPEFALLVSALEPGSEREADGIALYRRLRRAVADRHGDTVAGVFAFVFSTGIVTGGSGSVIPELAPVVEATLRDLPEEWLRTDVSRLLEKWVSGAITTDSLRVILSDVSSWLMNYGSQDPRVQEMRVRIHRHAM